MKNVGQRTQQETCPIGILAGGEQRPHVTSLSQSDC